MKTIFSRFLLPVYSILIAALLVIPWQISAPVYAQGNATECWAVIIGVSDYKNLVDLIAAENDAQDLASQLRPVWGDDHIKLLTNSKATKQDIEDAVTEWLAPREDSDDTVLFYWSGRYYFDGYLMPHDSLMYSINNDISADELDSWLGTLESEKILAIVPGSVFPDVLSETGRIILSSSRANENSWSTSELDHGIFTYYILEALKEFEEADSNDNYELSAEEVFEYAKTRTTDYSTDYSGINTQHPQMSDRYTGELSLLIKVTADAEIGTTRDTNILRIDGNPYSPRDLPESFIWVPGSHHEFEVISPVPDGDEKRYVFNSWDDGNSSDSRIISSGGVYTVDYTTQYHLQVDSIYGEPEGGGWYDSGTTAEISIGTLVEDGETRYFFTEWSGDYSGDAASASVVMDKQKTVSAGWRTEYQLTIKSEYGEPQGGGWYDSGATAEISIGTLVEEAGTKHFFTGWSGDYSGDTASSSVVMDKPKTVSAGWRTEYQLTIESEYDEPQGEGWYDSGATAEISVESPVGMIVRQVFTGWSGDYSVDTTKASIIIDGPKTLTANWRTDYIQLYILIIGVAIILGGLGGWLIIRRRRVPNALSETTQQPPSTTRCSNCGAKIEPGDSFCINCGKPVKDN